MTLRRIVGAIILLIVFGAFFALTATKHGIADAIKAWATAIVTVTLIVVGTYLLGQ